MNVWAVHVVMAREVRPTDVVYAKERDALRYAADRSRDAVVLAACVTRFTLDELGNKLGVAMFVNGTRQEVPHLSDCRTIYSSYRERA